MAVAVDNAPKSREGRSGKERLLDAAEQLFAQRGFDGVSVRDITEAARVDVALVSYHFGGKRELFVSIFQRRAEQLNADRAQYLQNVLAAALPDIPSIDELINAYVQPMLRLSQAGEPGWNSYFRIVAQVNNSPHWAPLLMTQHYDPEAGKLISALQAALPGVPAAEIFWAIQFLAGSVTMTFAQTGRIDRLSGGLCTSTDLKTALERLVPYASAGFHALANRTPTPAGDKALLKRERKAAPASKRDPKARAKTRAGKKSP